eukprot:1158431-Pelagomonas_calceolata.AAC.13
MLPTVARAQLAASAASSDQPTVCFPLLLIRCTLHVGSTRQIDTHRMLPTVARAQLAASAASSISQPPWSSAACFPPLPHKVHAAGTQHGGAHCTHGAQGPDILHAACREK